MDGIGTGNLAIRTRAFLDAYEAARAARSAALAEKRERKRRRRTRKPRSMPDGLNPTEQHRWQLKEQLRLEEAKKFIENARFEADLIKDRLQRGFRLFAPRMVYGRRREDVCEAGLRSEAFGLPGKMFVTACRKGGELRTSWDKANLGVESDSKLLSLDLPYVEGNRTFLAFWRIDLDQVWPSIDAFIDDILQLVGCEIPFAPHLVAGDERPDGSFARPHLYFLLPPGQAVWNDPDDRRCNKRTVSFFEAVYFGIVDALKDLQADPGAPATTQRGKNPLSPLSTSFVMNDKDFLSMSDWATWVDTSLCREALVRTRAAEKAGVDVKTSNEFFSALQTEAYRVLRRWHFEADKRLRGPEGIVADNLHQALEPVALQMVADATGQRRISEAQVAALVSRVASYAAGSFDPARLEKGVVRKALMHVVDGLASVRERQQVAAAYATKQRSEKTMQRLVDAWDALAVETTDITKSALARAAGVSRPTIYARWAELQAVLTTRDRCKVRCIDKKLASFPVASNFLHTVRDDRATAIVIKALDEVADLTGQGVPDNRTEVIPCSKPMQYVGVARYPSVLESIEVPAADIMDWEDGSDDDDQDARTIAEQEAFLLADLERLADTDEEEPWDDDVSGDVANWGEHGSRLAKLFASIPNWYVSGTVGRQSSRPPHRVQPDQATSDTS